MNVGLRTTPAPKKLLGRASLSLHNWGPVIEIANQFGLSAGHMVFAIMDCITFPTEVIIPNPGDSVCDVVAGTHGSMAATAGSTLCAWGMRSRARW